MNLTGNGTTVSIDSSMFESNQYGVTVKLSGNTTILSTTFSKNSYALTFEVDSPTSRMEQKKSLEIHESTFADNEFGLFATTLYYSDYLLLLRLSKNKFFWSQIYVYNHAGSCDSVLKAEIDECRFFMGHISIDVCQNYSLELNNSKLSETSTLLNGNCRSLTIFNNEFSKFNGNSLTVSTYPTGFQRICNNTFVDNKGFSCISLTTAYRENLPPGQFLITGNTFKNNSVDSVVYIREGVPSDIQLNGNAFENPSSRYDLYQATPWKAGYLVDASRNWWGISDSDVALSRIYDFYTDFLSAMVEMSSIYKEPEMVSVIDTSSSRDLQFDEPIVGGRLRQNTSIDLHTVGKTYTIDIIGPIYVPPNMELKLIGSKILNFASNAGILVEGKIRLIVFLYYVLSSSHVFMISNFKIRLLRSHKSDLQFRICCRSLQRTLHCSVFLEWHARWPAVYSMVHCILFSRRLRVHSGNYLQNLFKHDAAKVRRSMRRCLRRITQTLGYKS